jgi:hypothetical protein
MTVETEKENFPMERQSFPFWPSATALRTTGLSFVAACSMLVSPSAQADRPMIVIFDAPGVPIPPVAGPSVGTAAYAINPEGAVAGFYSDANAVVHGSYGPPFAVNPTGQITGDVIDPNDYGVNRAFLRLSDE